MRKVSSDNEVYEVTFAGHQTKDPPNSHRTSNPSMGPGKRLQLSFAGLIAPLARERFVRRERCILTRQQQEKKTLKRMKASAIVVEGRLWRMGESDVSTFK